MCLADNGMNHAKETTLSEALKTNTTLTKLNLYGERKRNKHHEIHQQFTLFSILVKSTGSSIGETGAKSLSDALKSNSTLMVLDLSCKEKETTHK